MKITRFLTYYHTEMIIITNFNNIFIVCRSGYFGENCEIRCGQCVKGSKCDSGTGACPKGCAPGWDGKLCVEGKSNNFSI